MRPKSFIHPNRRQVIKGLSLASASVFMPTMMGAYASSQDDFARARVLRDTDREGNTLAALDAINSNEPILSINTANNLQLAIIQYEQIVANGGWKLLSKNVYGLIVGNNRNGVNALRNRLLTSGDVQKPKKTDKDMFDERLDAGLRFFQARHGLTISGKVDAETYYALNVPAENRLAQLRLNALRVNNLTGSISASDRYVVVNIPAASIEAIDSSTVTQRHTAVVGRADRQTPILQSKIHQINFNPYWHVPKSIIRKDLTKYMQEDPEYLTKFRIIIYDGNRNIIDPKTIDWTTDEAVKYAFRQEPGAENSLGRVRINFRNKHSVYLHDTPGKSLFGQNRRFNSSGCVRVEKVDEMVAWLLSRNEGWDVTSVNTMFNSGERVDVLVKSPPIIHMTYITAWANNQGSVNFRDDVYDFDKAGKVVFEDA